MHQDQATDFEPEAVSPGKILRFISNQELPIALKSVDIGEDGSIVRRDGEAPLHFDFKWRGMTFSGTVAPRKEGGNVIRLVADLGTVPYSAEHADSRHRLMNLVRHGLDTEGARITVGEHQTLRIVCETDLSPAPTTANHIVAEVTQMVLTNLPVFDALQAEVGYRA